MRHPTSPGKNFGDLVSLANFDKFDGYENMKLLTHFMLIQHYHQMIFQKFLGWGKFQFPHLTI